MTDDRRSDVERFAAAVVSRLGFHVHAQNENHVHEVLRRCLERTGSASVDRYLGRFQDAEFARRELHEIAGELTVPETYFFRHPEQFQALTEVVVPALVNVRGATRRLRVLSAGCATGEEAYSLAAALAGVPVLAGWDLRICGVDLNARFLEKARRARYPAWSLRALSDEQRRRYFVRDGDRYRLDATLTSLVSFESRNLLDDDPRFWQPDSFDVVFCRNVMIYFSAAAIRALADRLTRSLHPGGFLFLGPSETLRGISQAFHLEHTHGVFYYQRRLPHEQPEAVGGDAPPPATASPAAGPDAPEPAWASSIEAASARIAALAPRADASGAARETAPVEPGRATVPGPDLDEVRELLRQERFDEALAALGAPGADARADADTLLLEAVVRANRRDLAGAEQRCQELLASDELRPGAHYLLAFCHERRGDYLSAAEHDQAAIYLDPTFAMPHLHLGLLAKHLGDLPTARRELHEALTLLARDDASRILLFGGGFARETLVRFCRVQLDLCGEAR